MHLLETPLCFFALIQNCGGKATEAYSKMLLNAFLSMVLVNKRTRPLLYVGWMVYGAANNTSNGQVVLAHWPASRLIDAAE